MLILLWQHYFELHRESQVIKLHSSEAVNKVAHINPLSKLVFRGLSPQTGFWKRSVPEHHFTLAIDVHNFLFVKASVS